MPYDANDNNNNNENSMIADFTGNRENTMNKALVNSIAITLLKLKETYFLDLLSDSDMDTQYNDTMKRIALEARDEERKKFLALLQEKADEEVDPNLDIVTLYVQDENNNNNQNQRVRFTLKEVIILVWAALTDDEKFAHHYMDQSEHISEEEHEKRRKQDKKHRISSFFKIPLEGVCHTGVRNGLVFLLNETYPGVHLIEDAHGAIFDLSREKIQTKFWEAYTQATLDSVSQPITNTGKQEEETDKQTLSTALFTWMRDSNPQEILKIVDPQQTIIQEIHEYFKQHGINPQELKLDTLIQQAFSALPFSCDPKKYRTLSAINIILSAPKEKDPTIAAALKSMRKDIQKNPQWIDPTNQNHEQQHVQKFARIYTTYQTLKKNQFLLTQVGKWENFETLNTQCVAYLENSIENDTIPNTLEDLDEQCAALEKAIHEIKEDKMYDQIENFFYQWFDALNIIKENQEIDSDDEDDEIDEDALEEASQRETQYYTLFLNETFQKKVIVTDDEIDRFVTSNPGYNENYIDVNPYWINRVLLTGIFIPPQEWTPLFGDTFKTVRALIKNNFNEESSERTNELRENSYPEQLQKQLAYLESCWKESRDDLSSEMEASDEDGLTSSELRSSLEDMLLLPRDVKSFTEWQTIANRLDDTMLKTVYDPIKIKVNAIIETEMENEENTPPTLQEILTTIPKIYRSHFFNKYQNRIQGFLQFHSIFRLLPEKAIMEYAENKGNIREYAMLNTILPYLPKDKRLPFVKEFEDLISDSDQNGLSDIVSAIPHENRLEFALDQKNKVNTLLEFTKILCFLSEEKKQLIWIEVLKEKADNIVNTFEEWQLPAICVMKLKKDSVKNRFFEILQPKAIPLIMEALGNINIGLSDILTTMPEAYRVEYFQKYLSYALDKDDEFSCLRHLPKEAVLEYVELKKTEGTLDIQTLVEIVYFIPRNQRLELLNTYKNIIQNAEPHYWGVLLAHLSTEDQLIFIEDLEIQSIEKLTHLLFSINNNEQLKRTLVKKHENKIQDIKELLHMILVFPEDRRLETALLLKEKIQNFGIGNFCFILTAIPLDQRMQLVKQYQLDAREKRYLCNHNWLSEDQKKALMEEKDDLTTDKLKFYSTHTNHPTFQFVTPYSSFASCNTPNNTSKQENINVNRKVPQDEEMGLAEEKHSEAPINYGLFTSSNFSDTSEQENGNVSRPPKKIKTQSDNEMEPEEKEDSDRSQLN